MRAIEFITEAYHSKLATQELGKWTVHIDSHAFVSLTDRNISLRDFTNILSYAFVVASDNIEKIPRGTGAFIQDINTNISVYVSKSKSFPLDITVETVLAPTMTPKDPVIKIAVPLDTRPDAPAVLKAKTSMKKKIDASSRDDMAQQLDNFKDRPPLNREQRRALDKQMRSKK